MSVEFKGTVRVHPDSDNEITLEANVDINDLLDTVSTLIETKMIAKMTIVDDRGGSGGFILRADMRRD